MNSNFELMHNITNCAIKEHVIKLEQRANKHPTIGRFIDVLMFPMTHGTIHESQESIDSMQLSHQLSQLLYQICSYDFYTNITNRIQGDWAYELNSFISNYLLDDFYFKLEKTGPHHTWLASNAESGLQDANLLVDAAKYNVIIHNQIDAKIAKKQEIRQQLRLDDLA